MKIAFSVVLMILLVSCGNSEKQSLAHNIAPKITVSNPDYRTLSEEFKDYWYAGTAEITSYDLSQERYGEIRTGTAVNVFVTEDFRPKTQVKADRPSEDNIPVLKLNTTKKFLTGIYPYSVMTSTFSPTTTENHAIKISHSMQEWCGHVYVQLNNRKQFELESHSYFEGEADKEISLSKDWLENEIWNIIRINPEDLPTGDFEMIPSFEYFRFAHKELKAYKANAQLLQGDSETIYNLNYHDLKRSLRIHFNSNFPFEIDRWEETHSNGLKTTAVKKEQIRSAYWSKNSNKDVVLRDSLGLN